MRIESIEHRPDGAIALQVRASRGFAVTLESSTDMVAWIPVATRSSDEELWTYIDTAPRDATLFYRARIRP